MAKKRPPSGPDPAPRRAGLWSTFEKAILGGWGPTLRLVVLLLAGGIILHALMPATNTNLLGFALRTLLGSY
ncbi:hypothetical protein VR010_00935 [Actinomycetaceae bacterium L2_0104]